MKQITFFLMLISFVAVSAHENLSDAYKLEHLTNPQQDSLQFSISPNPVKDQILFIKTQSRAEKHIEIFNVLGEKKFETYTTNESIFLGELSPGIYIFRMQQEGKSGLKRLVIP